MSRHNPESYDRVGMSFTERIADELCALFDEPILINVRHTQSYRAVRATLDVMKASLRAHKAVNVKGFGTFRVVSGAVVFDASPELTRMVKESLSEHN